MVASYGHACKSMRKIKLNEKPMLNKQYGMHGHAAMSR